MMFSHLSWRIVLLAALALIPFAVRAQPAVQRPAAVAAEPCCGISPCCGITSIDLRGGHVVAQVNGSKRVIEFVMPDRVQLMQLKVGQPVYANFKTNRVSVSGASPCCGIVPTSPTLAPAQAPPPAPAPAPAPAAASASKSEPKQTTKSTAGAVDSTKVDVSTVTPNEGTTTTAIRGVLSDDSENARGENGPHIAPKTRSFVANAPHSVGRSRRLKDDPAIDQYVKLAVWALKGFEIKSALLAGHKYMINDCLGMKVDAGEFALTVPDPDLRVVGDGLVLTFTVAHIAMDAFSVRLRPDPTDVVEPCHFSGKVGISGAADQVRYELHFDPVLDLDQCKIGSLGQVHQVWRIGTLHLDPLPSAVSAVAGDMIEDSLTSFANYDLTDRIVAVLNAAADNQCHK